MFARAVVVVIPLGTPQAAPIARRLAAEGATVVLLADDSTADEAGGLAAELEAAGKGRPAVFVGDGAGDGVGDGVVAFLTELFRASGG